jgi:hypothetical protein
MAGINNLDGFVRRHRLASAIVAGLSALALATGAIALTN